MADEVEPLDWFRVDGGLYQARICDLNPTTNMVDIVCETGLGQPRRLTLPRSQPVTLVPEADLDWVDPPDGAA